MAADLTQVVKLLVDLKGFSTGMQNATRKLDGIGKQFGRIAAVAGVAFGTREILQFGNEAVKLASEMQGVEESFKRLTSAGTLDRLNAATGNTVTNLELMKKSVLAVQLGIDQAQLPTYFEFAAKRAQETGESIDYLVESIVKGVGRKSALILDNLGISALRLSEELQKGGTYAEAVGRIINEEMAKSGTLIETTAMKQARITKELEDQKVLLGQQLTPLYNGILKEINGMLKALVHMNQTLGQKGQSSAVKMWEIIASDGREAVRIVEDYNIKMAQLYRDQQNAADFIRAYENGQLVKNIDLYKARKEELERLNGLIPELETRYKAWAQQTFTASQAQAVTAITVGQLKDQIAALTQELDKQTTNAGYRKIAAEISTLEAEMQKLTDVSKNTTMVQDLQLRQLPRLAQSITALNTVNREAGEIAAQNILKIHEENQARKEQMQQLQTEQEVVNYFGQAFQDVFVSTLINGQNFFEQMGQYLKQLAVRLLAAAAAAAVLKTILSFGIGGGSSVLSFGQIFGQLSGFGNMFKSNGNIPGLASGGIVTGPTLAMVGEGGESEAILPLSKLNSLISNTAAPVVGTVKLSGYDQYIVFNRQDRRISRIS